MTDFKKISRWISELEQNLRDMRQHRSTTEARIAKKINNIVLSAVLEEQWGSNEKVDICRRLNRLAKLVDSEESTMATLEQVEKEVDAIYGNQSDNSTYYFGRKSARQKDLEEMEALTTYEPDHDTSEYDWEESMRVQDFENVRKLVKRDRPEPRKSSWSDYAEIEESFEDDSEWVDAPDLLDLDIGYPY